MSSRAVREGDKRSMCSLMSSGLRSGPRARRTWIEQVPESRSRSIGPRHRPWPGCGSPSARCAASCPGRPGRRRTGCQRSAGKSGSSVRGCRVLVSCLTPPIVTCSTVYAGAGQPLDSSWNGEGGETTYLFRGCRRQENTDHGVATENLTGFEAARAVDDRYLDELRAPLAELNKSVLIRSRSGIGITSPNRAACAMRSLVR